MVSVLTVKRKTVAMASRNDGRVEKDGERKEDSGGKSDKFPADDYLQAIPPHRRNLRPQPLSHFLLFIYPFSSFCGKFVTFA